jgi:hypothetical protein
MRAPQAPRPDVVVATLRNPSPMAGRRRRSASPTGGTHHAQPHQQEARDVRAIGGGRATTSGRQRGGREGGRDTRAARGEESSRETGCAGEGASRRGRVTHGVCAGVRDEMMGE